MKKTGIILSTFAGFMLSGCATIIEGNEQTVYFDTDPTGATCSIERKDEGMLYSSIVTPASLEISKDKDHLIITCDKEGYEKKVIHTDSNFEGWALGNLLFGGIIGVGVDAASGALNEYPSQVVIPLKKDE